jgi:hypothetical protein
MGSRPCRNRCTHEPRPQYLRVQKQILLFDSAVDGGLSGVDEFVAVKVSKSNTVRSKSGPRVW